MDEKIITSNEKGLDALFDISERVNNFGGRLAVKRVGVEPCSVKRIFKFSIPNIATKITLLEIESKSGLSGYYLPSTKELKEEYVVGENIGKMSIFTSRNVDGYLFSPELELKKARKKIVQGRTNQKTKRERRQNIIIAIEVAILLYFHVFLKLI